MTYQQTLFPFDARAADLSNSTAHPCPSYLFDFEHKYISHQQQRASYSTPRQHQEVVDATALGSSDLRRTNGDLVRRAAALDREAIAILAADVVGAPTHMALQVPLSFVPLQRRPVCLLNLASGMVERDYARLHVDRAARPIENGRGQPATWVAHIPMLNVLWQALVDLAGDTFKFGILEELLGASFDHRRRGLEYGTTGRLRSTWARRRNGMTVAAIESGLDHGRAALVWADGAAVNVARHYYTRLEQRDLYQAAADAYRAAGLGEPVPPPERWPEAFGSHVVPTQEVLIDAYNHCLRQLERLRPPRKYTRRQIVEFHLAYIHTAGWLLLFLIGCRPTAHADVLANKVLPGTITFRLLDKATEESGERRPVLLCRGAQTLILALWHHWREVERRLSKLERGLPPSELLKHARRVLARTAVSLLAIEDDAGTIVALGTHAIQAWFPWDMQIAENAGRHYWLTLLAALRIDTCHADAYARHSRTGTEAMSSISAISHHTSYRVVTAAQDAEIERLGLKPLVGL